MLEIKNSENGLSHNLAVNSNQRCGGIEFIDLINILLRKRKVIFIICVYVVVGLLASFVYPYKWIGKAVLLLQNMSVDGA